jgi:hypothetical protein
VGRGKRQASAVAGNVALLLGGKLSRESESLRDNWPTAASLTPDRRVMFVVDGHRAIHELIEVPRVLDQRSLRELGWVIEVRPLAGPFFLGLGGRAG